MTTIYDIQNAMGRALGAAGHGGSACGLDGFTCVLGPSGGQVRCRCGAIMWTRDLARLMRFREIGDRVRGVIAASEHLALDNAGDREALSQILCNALLEDLP